MVTHINYNSGKQVECRHGQGNGHKNNDKPNGSDVKKTSTVVKDFVVDYTTATRDPLMEYETNGFTYRYVYGNERLSVNVTGVEQGAGKLIENGNQIRLYYHTDLRGTFDYLTSPMSQKIESWTHYNEWGEITHNAVLKCGQRELDLVKNYTGHDYDSVLSQYYAKARMYDAGDRRFTSMDPVKGNINNPLTLVQYLYVINNPLIMVDPLGKYFIYKHTDENGIPYYVITDQSKFDAVVSPFLPGNIQAAAHELFQGGTVVAGTSIKDHDFQMDFEQIYAAEIEQAKAGLLSVGPQGAMVVGGYEVLTNSITLLTEVPKNWGISNRDDQIISIMKDAEISTTSYSNNFISAAAAADQFVQDYTWMFKKQKILGNKSPYTIGKELYTNDESQVAKTAKSNVYTAYYNAIHDQILAELIGGSANVYATYRQKNYINYPSQIVPGISWNDLDEKYHVDKNSEIVWSSDLANMLADQITEEIMDQLMNNYQVTIEYFQSIFCEEK